MCLVCGKAASVGKVTSWILSPIFLHSANSQTDLSANEDEKMNTTISDIKKLLFSPSGRKGQKVFHQNYITHFNLNIWRDSCTRICRICMQHTRFVVLEASWFLIAVYLWSGCSWPILVKQVFGCTQVNTLCEAYVREDWNLLKCCLCGLQIDMKVPVQLSADCAGGAQS